MTSSNCLITEFNTTASEYDNVAHLPRIVGERLIKRLDDLDHFKPQAILDLGCGTGFCLQLLKQRYPNSHLIGIDWSYPLLEKAKLMSANSVNLIQGDIEKLPFKLNTFDLISANLSLLWIHDLKAYLKQVKQFLKPGGLLLFTLFGVETFDPLPKTNPPYPWGFSDMHTIGDILASSKWQHIVTDVDQFITEHNDITACYKELKQLGFHTLLNNYQTLEDTIKPTTDYTMKWEIIYASAFHMDQAGPSEPQEISIPINQFF